MVTTAVAMVSGFPPSSSVMPAPVSVVVFRLIASISSFRPLMLSGSMNTPFMPSARNTKSPLRIPDFQAPLATCGADVSDTHASHDRGVTDLDQPTPDPGFEVLPSIVIRAPAALPTCTFCVNTLPAMILFALRSVMWALLIIADAI